MRTLTKPAVLHDNLVSWDGALLAPESSMGTDGSQQWAPKKLFDFSHPTPAPLSSLPHKKQLTAETAENSVETEATSEPRPSTCTACCSSGTRSLAQRIFTDCSKKQCFRDDVTV
ncbi:unnamed protein product [Caretta caretta]